MRVFDESVRFSYVCACMCSREPFIILSGGLSYDTVGRRPCLTVMHGKSTAVLEMDYPIVDFLTLCETPYPNGKGFHSVFLRDYHTVLLLSMHYALTLIHTHTHTHQHTFLFFNYVRLPAPVC